jgi:two-component system, NtrC family, sensor kinase
MESRPVPAALAWCSGLKDLLAEHELWLMERVLAYAKVQGYTAYTSTLVEAWRVSIAGLTDAITAALRAFDGHLHEYPVSPTVVSDPIADFATCEAKLHRKRGVTLAMFWGLLKYYGRAYLDLLDEHLPPGQDREAARTFLAECFERMEFAFVLGWTKLSGEEARDALARENLWLSNEKNKYLTVFESIPSALFLLDADDRVENCNTAALALVGYTSPTGKLYYASADTKQDGVCRAVLGRPITELLPWLSAALGDAGASGGRVSLETMVGTGEQARHYSAVIDRMCDISGKFVGKVLLCRDATMRRRTELALAQSEERFRSVVDIMHQGLVIFSPEGRIDFANSTMVAMLGYTLEEITGQPATFIIRSEDHKRFAESLAGRQNGGAEPYEMALRRKDGKLVFIMSSPSPIIGQDGDYQGSLEVLTDVSRLRELELQLLTAKRLEAIGHLAGGVAHEINTPLQYVSGNLDFAMANVPRLIALLGKYEQALSLAEDCETLDAARKDIEAFRLENDMEMVLAELPLALDESLHGAEQVASFVRSIKRFAQTEGPGRRVIDVNEAIRATVEVAKSAQESSVNVELDLAGDLPPLPCVPGDFNQLLLCLLLNAAQAVEREEKPTGCVRVASRREGASIAVSVSDTGIGIPPEIQDKIFNPFFSTREVGKGGGQGLSIALSIVEKHKGTIRFVSEPGHGTTFHVTFPLESPA